MLDYKEHQLYHGQPWIIFSSLSPLLRQQEPGSADAGIQKRLRFSRARCFLLLEVWWGFSGKKIKVYDLERCLPTQLAQRATWIQGVLSGARRPLPLWAMANLGNVWAWPRGRKPALVTKDDIPVTIPGQAETVCLYLTRIGGTERITEGAHMPFPHSKFSHRVTKRHLHESPYQRLFNRFVLDDRSHSNPLRHHSPWAKPSCLIFHGEKTREVACALHWAMARLPIGIIGSQSVGPDLLLDLLW